MAIFRNMPIAYEMDEAMVLLDRWHLSASSNGCLWIEARTKEVKLADFCVLVKRIRRVLTPGRFSAIALHFDDVEVSSSLWPVFTELAASLARQMQATCRIIQYNKTPVSQADTSRSSQQPSSANRVLRLEGTCIVIEQFGEPAANAA